MSRLYLIATVVLFIVVPHTVNCFFLQSLTNISVSRNISCQVSNGQTLSNTFQLCAIRIYTNDGLPYPVYTGLRYGSSFYGLRISRCEPTLESSPSGIGITTCRPLTSFETFQSMQLCICATDNCNQNLTTCIASVSSTADLPAPSLLVPNLSTYVPCASQANTSFLCADQPFIDAPSCEAYVRNNSVMCAISIDGTQVTQRAFVQEDYDRFLTEKVYQFVTFIGNSIASYSNQTATNFYYGYPVDDSRSIQECACTSFSICNSNTSTCVSQNLAQSGTTMFTASATGMTLLNSATPFTSVVPTSAAGMTSASLNNNGTLAPISSVMNVTAVSAANSRVTSMTSLNNATAFTSVVPTSAAGMTSASLKNNGTLAPASSAMTVTATYPAITSAASTNSRNMTAATTAARTPAATTTIAISVVTNERGLGSGPTAGIVCGIIFCALLFIGEIAFFKFVYPRLSGSSPERSVTYRA